HAAEVARREPAVEERVRRDLGLLVVAVHERRRADEDLAGALAVGLADLDLDAGDRLADRARLRSGGGAVRADDRARLGQAVALVEVDPEPVEGRRHLARERRAAADGVAELAAELAMDFGEEARADVETGALAEAAVDPEE